MAIGFLVQQELNVIVKEEKKKIGGKGHAP